MVRNKDRQAVGLDGIIPTHPSCNKKDNEEHGQECALFLEKSQGRINDKKSNGDSEIRSFVEDK